MRTIWFWKMTWIQMNTFLNIDSFFNLNYEGYTDTQNFKNTYVVVIWNV